MSETDKLPNAARAYECLYDVAWQVRRVKYPMKWKTEQGVRENISDMLAYIGAAKEDYWKMVRIHRVSNMIYAGQRVAEKYGNEVGVKLINTFIKGLGIEWARLTTWRWKDRGSPKAPGRASPDARNWKYKGPFKPWSWGKVQADLIKLHSNDHEMFIALSNALEKRFRDSPKVTAWDTIALTEMGRFVRMIRDVEFEAHA